MKKIQIACKGHSNIAVEDLKPFQGNLKDLSELNYQKLKGEILRLGFSEPISVWHKNGNNYILNGHQRLRTITKMINDEGYECDSLPVNLIEAKDKKEAKQKVLALTSQFGEITEQGLYEFLSDSEIDYHEIEDNYRFPEVNTTSFIENFYSNDGKDGEGTGNSAADVEGDIAWNDELAPDDNYIVVVFNDKDEFKSFCDKSKVISGLHQLSTTDNENFLCTGIGRVIPYENIKDQI